MSENVSLVIWFSIQTKFQTNRCHFEKKHEFWVYTVKFSLTDKIGCDDPTESKFFDSVVRRNRTSDVSCQIPYKSRPIKSHPISVATGLSVRSVFCWYVNRTYTTEFIERVRTGVRSDRLHQNNMIFLRISHQ